MAFPRRTPDLLFVLLALWAMAFAGAPVFTNDVFWHVATGQHLLAEFAAGRAFPTVDPFSYTAQDQVWVLHEWLFQVGCAVLHRLGGLPLLRLCGALATLAILWLVRGLFARGLGSPWWGLCGATLWLALGSERLQLRPTLVTILAILLLCRVLLTARPFGWRHVALLGLLQGIWTNAHSVGLLGVVLLLAHTTGESCKPLLQRHGAVSFPRATPAELGRRWLAVGLAFVASLLTPQGLHLWAFALQDKSDVMQYVPDEWGAFHFWYPHNEALTVAAWLGVLLVMALLLTTYLGLAVALQKARPRLLRLPDPACLLLLLALFGLGLLARRFHWFHALAALLCLSVLRDLLAAGALPRLPALGTRLRLPARAMLAAGLGLLCWTTLQVEERPLPLAFGDGYLQRSVRRSFDLATVRFLREAGLQGNALCTYGSGGILSHALHPAIRVHIDSRIDLYRREIYLEWLAIRAGRRDQTALLDARGCTIYCQHWDLPPPQEPQAWVQVFAEGSEAVWLRRVPQNADNLERSNVWRRARGLAPLPDVLLQSAAPR